MNSTDMHTNQERKRRKKIAKTRLDYFLLVFTTRVTIFDQRREGKACTVRKIVSTLLGRQRTALVQCCERLNRGQSYGVNPDTL